LLLVAIAAFTIVGSYAADQLRLSQVRAEAERLAVGAGADAAAYRLLRRDFPQAWRELQAKAVEAGMAHHANVHRFEPSDYRRLVIAGHAAELARANPSSLRTYHERRLDALGALRDEDPRLCAAYARGDSLGPHAERSRALLAQADLAALQAIELGRAAGASAPSQAPAPARADLRRGEARAVCDRAMRTEAASLGPAGAPEV
jgi:hypothetical protein